MHLIKSRICKIVTVLFAMQCFYHTACTQNIKSVNEVFVDSGWAGNSINTVVFRKNSLCTYKNTQYISFYNADSFVVLGKRQLGSKKWDLSVTKYKGNIADAHNSISIIVDGNGYLHLAWNHHNNQLHYCKSIAPGSLQMTNELSMTGLSETRVTYPEFYSLPNGNLIFLYRNGESGKGNLIINQYDLQLKRWQQMQQNLIDGEGKRNAYWQACVDKNGTIHLSWVWRESPDVSSNHDLCYAKSIDGGLTWQNSQNQTYSLPIKLSDAEYVCNIPQQSELINQTSICADEEGSPFVISYWKELHDSVPQYHIVYNTSNHWSVINTGFRKTAFSLSGTGTKRIPISRPQLIYMQKKSFAIIYRDAEREDKISAAITKNIDNNTWELKDITNTSAGSWEPTYDTELWKQKRQLHLFLQYTDQQDGEGKSNLGVQPVRVLEVEVK